MKPIGYYPQQFATKAEIAFIAANPTSPLAIAYKRIGQACDLLNTVNPKDGMNKQYKEMLAIAVEMKGTKTHQTERILL